MHSRIFELKKTKNAPNMLDEDSISDTEQNCRGMDYISETDANKAQESIEWFRSCYKTGIVINMREKSIRFTEPEQIMKPYFETWKEIINQLNGFTLSDFMGQEDEKNSPGIPMIPYPMFSLNEAYDPKSEFYIYYENEIQSLLSFIRTHFQTLKTTVFYFGNVLDYHY